MSVRQPKVVRDAIRVKELVATPVDGEHRTLARLVRAGVAVADGYITPVREEVVREAIEAVLEDSDHVGVRLLSDHDDLHFETGRDGAAQATDRFVERIRRRDGWVHVAPVDASPAGRAWSADSRGDPDEVSVLARDAERPWCVDRRSGRVSTNGDDLSAITAESAADLADRAQLALGFPVEITWRAQDGRLRLWSARPLETDPAKTAGSWSRLALVAADEGTVAPLAIDALDRALGTGQDAPSVDSTVRRVYARPYRRRQRVHALGQVEPSSLGRAAAAAARVTAEAAPLLADAARFERDYESVIERLDAFDLRTQSDVALIDALRERHRFVADAFLLLDRARAHTRHGLEALEAISGPLNRQVYGALAAPRAVDSRRVLNERLAALVSRLREARSAEEALEIPSYDQLDVRARSHWDDVRAKTSQTRPLGIDVVPLPIGSSDQDLADALHRLPKEGDAAREHARGQALEVVVKQAQGLSLGLPRVALTRSLGMLLARIARAKGGISEGLAAALLRLRRAACEVGRRLEHEAILDAPEDGLYLGLDELAQALGREPGAYAARVRLRREDDQRWAHYAAPRRLGR